MSKKKELYHIIHNIGEKIGLLKGVDIILVEGAKFNEEGVTTYRVCIATGEIFDISQQLDVEDPEGFFYSFYSEYPHAKTCNVEEAIDILTHGLLL